MSGNPSKQLRLATRSWHRKLEEAKVFSVLPTDSVSLDDYCLALRVLQGFYSEIESAVIELTGDLPYSPRLPLLHKDLTSLGLARDLGLQRETQTMTAAAAWGCRYVIEGSTLGGAILAKHLASRFGNQLDRSMHFYSFSNPDLSWPRVQARLDSVLYDPTMLAEACESSCLCFDKIYRLATAHE